MKKGYIRITFECIGFQILFSVISMGLYTGFFSDVLFSIFTAWLFTWSIHSTFWQLGNKEMKKVKIINKNLKEDEPEVKLNVFKGALLGLPFFAINSLFLVITCILNKDILVTIESFLQFSFYGFLTPADDALGFAYFMPRFAVCLFMYMVCFGAYFSGSHNYSFIDKYYNKIIYKTKKNEDNK